MISGISHLLNEVDADLQLNAKVDEDPLNIFLLLLLLLQRKHVMVEILLQLLIDEVVTLLVNKIKLREECMKTNEQT